MSNKKTIIIKRSLSFPCIVFLVLLIIKLVVPTGATLSWWMVFLPLYLVPAIILGIVGFILGICLFCLAIVGVVMLIAAICSALS